MIAKALQYTIYDILAHVSRETVWQKSWTFHVKRLIGLEMKKMTKQFFVSRETMWCFDTKKYVCFTWNNKKTAKTQINS